MKQIKSMLVISAVATCFTVTNSCSQTTTPDTSTVLAVFTASTPCSEGTRPLPAIPANAPCEFIQWNLTLYQNPKTFMPTTFELIYVFGLSQQGTPGFINGGKKEEMQGQWSIVKGGASNPNAIIYQLTDNKTDKTISFLKLSDNLLHLPDTDRRLMIGSAAFSYTLNRIDNPKRRIEN
jgi:hypothetical protein